MRRGSNEEDCSFIFRCISIDSKRANIETKVLSTATPMKIVLSPALTTTLLFPGPLSGTFGLGLVAGNNAQAASGGTVQVEHPDGSNVLVLHALTETARVLATVLLDGKLYVFDLSAGAQLRMLRLRSSRLIQRRCRRRL